VLKEEIDALVERDVEEIEEEVERVAPDPRERKERPRVPEATTVGK